MKYYPTPRIIKKYTRKIWNILKLKLTSNYERQSNFTKGERYVAPTFGT
jgi:hypothetical protein